MGLDVVINVDKTESSRSGLQVQHDYIAGHVRTGLRVGYWVDFGVNLSARPDGDVGGGGLDESPPVLVVGGARGLLNADGMEGPGRGERE